MPTSTSLLVTKITKIYRFRPAAAVENGLKSGKYLQSWVWQSVRNRKGFLSFLLVIRFWVFCNLVDHNNIRRAWDTQKCHECTACASHNTNFWTCF